MKIGINTYGVSKNLTKDFQGTLKELKEIGITSLEPILVFVENVNSPESIAAHKEAEKNGMTGGHWQLEEAKKKFYEAHELGFEIRSAQMFGPGWKEPFLEKAIIFAKEQGIRYYVLNLNMERIEDAEKTLEPLQYALEKMKKQGIELLIHNHETEWKEDQESCVFEFLMEKLPALNVELDVGWVKFAGRDCIDVIKKHKDRIRILHFKDICEGASRKNRNTCFTAVGEGTIPLREILEVSNELELDKVGYILDQDNSLGDMMHDIRVGVKNLSVQEKPV